MTVADLRRLLVGFDNSDRVIACLDPDGQPFDYSADAIRGREAFIADDGDGLYECDPDGGGSRVFLLIIHG